MPPSSAVTMEKKAISIPGSKLYGPYTPGVKAGGVVWLSGQIDVEIGDDISSQTKGALAKNRCAFRGCWTNEKFDLFCPGSLDDINDFQAMNEVYGDWVDSIDVKPSARAAFEGSFTAGAKVEIVVQAIDTTSHE